MARIVRAAAAALVLILVSAALGIPLSPAAGVPVIDSTPDATIASPTDSDRGEDFDGSYGGWAYPVGTAFGSSVDLAGGMLAVGAPTFAPTGYYTLQGVVFDYGFVDGEWVQRSAAGSDETGYGRSVAVTTRRLISAGSARYTGLFGSFGGSLMDVTYGLPWPVASYADGCGASSPPSGFGSRVAAWGADRAAAGDVLDECVLVIGPQGKKALSGSDGTGFGSGLAMLENWVIVGMPYADEAEGCDAEGTGCVLAIPYVDGVWSMDDGQVLDGIDLEWAGTSVSAGGSRVVVAGLAAGTDTEHASDAQGDACTYALTAGTWTLEGCVAAEVDRGADDGFACTLYPVTSCAVAMSETGTTIAIGAPHANTGVGEFGLVYSLEFSGGEWVQTGSYASPSGSRFGWRVAVSDDVVVGVLPEIIGGGGAVLEQAAAVHLWGTPTTEAPSANATSTLSNAPIGTQQTLTLDVPTGSTVTWAAAPQTWVNGSQVQCPALSGSGATRKVTPTFAGSCSYTYDVISPGGFGWGGWSVTSIVVATLPEASVKPTVTGTVRMGGTLRAVRGTWSGNPTPAFATTWWRCTSVSSSTPATTPSGCTQIPGQSASTYTMVAADRGKAIRVRVVATNSAGSTTAFSASTARVMRSPESTSSPTISGRLAVGRTLRLDRGDWAGDSLDFGIAWQRCPASGGSCTAIAGATGTTYLVRAADEGKRLRAVVTATNSVGAASQMTVRTAIISAR